jgi:hypothetical protein
MGERPKPTYVESSIWYYFAGCYPIYSAGRRVDYWMMKMYPDLQTGLAEMGTSMVGPDDVIDAICPAGRAIDDVDRVCRRALAGGQCRGQGKEFLRCTLSPSDRLSLVAKE